LKAAIDSLPTEVPYGVDSDDIAIFSGSPRTHIQQDDEAWENLDPLLNRIVGYGVTPEIISQRIRRGKYGMDGMFTWLKVCVEELNISEGLLEGKIERLIDAMILLCVKSPYYPWVSCPFNFLPGAQGRAQAQQQSKSHHRPKHRYTKLSCQILLH
jgi:hypothetical protein